MKMPPFSIERIHFVGIGGIGMSGIAEILHQLGYQVQGSDLSRNNNVIRLEKLGIKILQGHDEANIDGCDVVVISSAVSNTNPEVVKARELHLPVVKRAEMLAELMRLKWTISVGGSHGKTTTTSLISTMLKQAGCDPTIITGGIINALGTNAILGKGDMMVVEADESDGSFQYLPSTMVIATNIDPEHMDYYGSLDALKDAFVKFVNNIPFYGLGVVCGDDKNIQSILPAFSNKRIVTYGFSASNNVQATNVVAAEGGMMFDVIFNESFKWSNVAKIKEIKGLFLPMFGEHNILNALATLCVAQEMGISEANIRDALNHFSGVKRRFTITGVVNTITFVDDYAHHPTEIKAVLDAADKFKKGRLLVVMQPHRYSRLKEHFSEFVDAFVGASIDELCVTPVYSAGEAEIENINSNALVRSMQSANVNAVFVESEDELKQRLLKALQPDDTVIFMGAGDITKWAYDMPNVLKVNLGV